jgi:hypothetical protein
MFRLEELPGLIGKPVGVDEKEIKAIVDRLAAMIKCRQNSDRIGVQPDPNPPTEPRAVASGIKTQAQEVDHLSLTPLSRPSICPEASYNRRETLG